MDPNIQTGKRTITVGSSTSAFEVPVAFKASFSTPPVVVVSQSSGGDWFYTLGSKSITKTGFTLVAKKTGPTGSTVIRAEWAAFPNTGG